MRYHVQLEFVGKDFAGWLKQPGLRTVEGVLTDVLTQVISAPFSLMGCSRTDAGVHARSYHMHLDTDLLKVPLANFPRVMNALLPRDIAIKSIEQAEPFFHAIVSAKRKTYRYSLRLASLRTVFDPFSWHVTYKLDIPLMVMAAKCLIGKHNFSSFCTEPSTKNNHIRDIKSIVWTEDKNNLYMDITADGFLYNMIRIIIGTLIEIGRKKLPATNLPLILARKDRRQAGPTAPACGLCLTSVDYK